MIKTICLYGERTTLAQLWSDQKSWEPLWDKITSYLQHVIPKEFSK